uniref:Bm8140 n=1 Tax=Brugia malayi TaxID=6279 RepID=A0A1I9GCG1_BRUMA|nr:Bm8140 [Brugia malayi]
MGDQCHQQRPGQRHVIGRMWLTLWIDPDTITSFYRFCGMRVAFCHLLGPWGDRRQSWAAACRTEAAVLLITRQPIKTETQSERSGADTLADSPYPGGH